MASDWREQELHDGVYLLWDGQRRKIQGNFLTIRIDCKFCDIFMVKINMGCENLDSFIRGSCQAYLQNVSG